MAPSPYDFLISLVPIFLILIPLVVLIRNSRRQARARERIATALENRP